MNPIILFDGVCNFCNGSVNFIIANDPAGVFRFAQIQSEIGQNYVKRFHLDDIDSVILIEDDHAFIYSNAALNIAKRIGGLWSVASVLRIIPRPIRDFFTNYLPKTGINFLERKRRVCCQVRKFVNDFYHKRLRTELFFCTQNLLPPKI